MEIDSVEREDDMARSQARWWTIFYMVDGVERWQEQLYRVNKDDAIKTASRRHGLTFDIQAEEDGELHWESDVEVGASTAHKIPSRSTP